MKTFRVTVVETQKKTVYVQAESEVMAQIKFRTEYPSFQDPNIAVTGVRFKDVEYLVQLPEGYREEYVEDTGFWTVSHEETGVKYTSKDRELAISKVSSEVSRRMVSEDTYTEAVDVAPAVED